MLLFVWYVSVGAVVAKVREATAMDAADAKNGASLLQALNRTEVQTYIISLKSYKEARRNAAYRSYRKVS
jgi:hypothetical protein